MGGIGGCEYRPTILTTGQTKANAKCLDPACRLSLSWPEIAALSRQGKVTPPIGR